MLHQLKQNFKMKRVTPVLKVQAKSDLELCDFSFGVVSSMKNNPMFAAQEIVDRVVQLSDANTVFDARIKAPISPTKKTDLQVARDEVIRLLRIIVNLIEVILADPTLTDDQRIQIITSAGMEMKSKNSSKREPYRFTVDNGEKEGEAILQSTVTKRASYIWQMCEDSSDVPGSTAEWKQIGVTTIATFTATDLIPGKKYWFRVASVVATKQGPWSDPLGLIAQ
ncbi:hypothetical protein WSM22_40000 [Cytophagales bacterium WSM2-2]|nr:hypothetical protein WSM22_40000 [Cytophagales bacterium WSM2-2]